MVSRRRNLHLLCFYLTHSYHHFKPLASGLLVHYLTPMVTIRRAPAAPRTGSQGSDSPPTAVSSSKATASHHPPHSPEQSTLPANGKPREDSHDGSSEDRSRDAVRHVFEPGYIHSSLTPLSVGKSHIKEKQGGQKIQEWAEGASFGTIS